MTELPWWQPSGILPIPVRFEPAPGSVRAQHGAALRAEREARAAEARADASFAPALAAFNREAGDSIEERRQG